MQPVRISNDGLRSCNRFEEALCDGGRNLVLFDGRYECGRSLEYIDACWSDGFLCGCSALLLHASGDDPQVFGSLFDFGGSEVVAKAWWRWWDPFASVRRPS